MLVEQTGHLLVQLADLLLEELQLLQHHLQQPSVHGLEFRARTERIAQLFRGGSQLLISQSGQSRRVGFSLSQRLQHAASTSAQQIRDQAGQLKCGPLPEETPIGFAVARDHASIGTFSASLSATDAARHRAQNSESIPEPPAVSPGVRHLGNPSCAPAARDWTAPAPNATFRTSVLRLSASRVAVSIDGCGLRDPLPARPTLTPQIQFLFIGSRVCSVLLSDLASRLSPCASLTLHLHQAG